MQEHAGQTAVRQLIEPAPKVAARAAKMAQAAEKRQSKENAKQKRAEQQANRAAVKMRDEPNTNELVCYSATCLDC